MHKAVDELVEDAIRSSPKSLKTKLEGSDIEEIKLCLGGFEGNPQSFRILTRLSYKATPKEEATTPQEDPTGIADDNFLGLDLTAASIDAVSKYPWGRKNIKDKKWGAYGSSDDDTSDLGTLKQTRKELEYDDPVIDNAEPKKSFECELMEWCDDVTYAVHDVEDFHMIGMIPLERIFRTDEVYEGMTPEALRAAEAKAKAKAEAGAEAEPSKNGQSPPVPDTSEWAEFRSYVIREWQKDGNKDYYGLPRRTDKTYLNGLRDDLIYRGGIVVLKTKPGSILALRRSLRRSSNLISWFTTSGVGCRGEGKPLLNLGELKIASCEEVGCDEKDCEGADCKGGERRLRHQCDMLKALIWKYVIDLPSMNTQQAGQGQIIRDLVKIYSDAENKKLLPRHYRELIKGDAGYARIGKLDPSDKQMKKLMRKLIRIRVAADYVSSFTEPQAVALHRRLTGIELGGFRDFI